MIRKESKPKAFHCLFTALIRAAGGPVAICAVSVSDAAARATASAANAAARAVTNALAAELAGTIAPVWL
ncbi:hypothetical protein [Rhodococcus qingshengii]|uniref:hypothetical protein n=1 Tax=Rhodococcus qingshengii TaxID=334542 RepID=UPI001F425916|nr:hypothetical protein [Rhodococcus qingshengii]